MRQRYKEGADLIKITATGGVLSQAKSGQNAQFSDDELEAIVSTAKDYGFKIAAHAHGDAGMRRAVIAGVSSIEHGTLMSQETMRLMKKYGTYYVPTIVAGKFVAEKAKEKGFSRSSSVQRHWLSVRRYKKRLPGHIRKASKLRLERTAECLHMVKIGKNLNTWSRQECLRWKRFNLRPSLLRT